MGRIQPWRVFDLGADLRHQGGYATMDERRAIKSLLRAGMIGKEMDPMTGWTTEELDKIEVADELEIASLGSNGTLRSPRTVWVVRLGDELFVRSVNGRTSGWFRGTQGRHEGRIRSGGVEKDVTFAEAGPGLEGRIDDAYRGKYQRYAKSIVDHTLTPEARAATLKLVPRP